MSIKIGTIATQDIRVGGDINPTFEGNNATLQKCTDNPIKQFGLQGKSNQETRSGYNLINESDKFKVSDGTASGITSSLTSEGYLQFNVVSPNGNYATNWWSNLSSDSYGNVDNIIKEGDIFTIAFTMRRISGNSNPPSIYIKDGMGYYPMLGSLTTSFSTCYYTGIWKTANNIRVHLGFSGLTGDFVIKNWMIKKGGLEDWQPYGIMPSPDYPSKINSVFGTANLFNYKTAPYLNAYIQISTMTIDPSNPTLNHQTSYIVCKPNTQYIITKKAGKSFRIGTSSVLPAIGVTINQTQANHTGTSQVITTNSNDKYLIFTCFSTYDGDTGTPAEMYATVIVREVGNLNIWTNNNNVYKALGENYTLNNGIVTNEYIEFSNEGNSGTNWFDAYYVKYRSGSLKPNSTYTLVYEILESSLISPSYASGGSAKNGQSTNVWNGWIATHINPVVGITKYKITTKSTIIESANNLLFQFWVNYRSTTLQKFKIRVMILEGDWTNRTIPNYYIGSSITSKLSLTDTLKSLPNGVMDEILPDGSIIRRVGEVTLYGTENFSLSTRNGEGYFGCFYTPTIAKLSNDADCILCNRFKHFGALTNMTENAVLSTNTAITFIIDKNLLSTPDINGFKTWLTLNPTTVQYELATPIIEQLSTDNKNAISQLRTFRGTSVIYNNDNILNPIMTGEYNEYESEIKDIYLNGTLIFNKFKNV